MEKLFNIIEDNKEHLSSQLYKDMIEAFAEAFAELKKHVNSDDSEELRNQVNVDNYDDLAILSTSRRLRRNHFYDDVPDW
jgi:rRNA maturation protein Rpf1